MFTACIFSVCQEPVILLMVQFVRHRFIWSNDFLRLLMQRERVSENWSIASGLSKECPEAHFQLCVLQKPFLHNLLATHISVYLLWTSAVTSLCMCVWAWVCDWCFNPALEKQEPKTGRFSCKSEHVFGPVRERATRALMNERTAASFLQHYGRNNAVSSAYVSKWLFILISICFIALLVC